MPAKKKEVKVEVPLFVDEEGSYVYEKECARYKGGVRRYTQVPPTADSATVSSARGRPAAEAATTAGSAPIPVYRHGRGVYTSPALEYEGQWIEDVMEGEGRLTFFTSGCVYVGHFHEGCFSGEGTYTWPDGCCYRGLWRANRMHGEGVYKDVRGQTWTGEYFNGTGPGLTRLYKAVERVAAVMPPTAEAPAASAPSVA